TRRASAAPRVCRSAVRRGGLLDLFNNTPVLFAVNWNVRKHADRPCTRKLVPASVDVTCATSGAIRCDRREHCLRPPTAGPIINT
ncbi:MAG TPA: hypothetical protein PK867_24170, partial [Pirellulales bacterium]|nr:hypothetical protein [Pirellulales bacterium]